jgi:hypothetical protein
MNPARRHNAAPCYVSIDDYPGSALSARDPCKHSHRTARRTCRTAPRESVKGRPYIMLRPVGAPVVVPFAHPVAPLLQEPPYRRVGFQANGAVIGLLRRLHVTKTAE